MMRYPQRRYPQGWEIVDRGEEGGREYVVTVCTAMGEPTDYGSRKIEAFYDRRLREARLRIKHFRFERPSGTVGGD